MIHTAASLSDTSWLKIALPIALAVVAIRIYSQTRGTWRLRALARARGELAYVVALARLREKAATRALSRPEIDVLLVELATQHNWMMQAGIIATLGYPERSRWVTDGLRRLLLWRTGYGGGALQNVACGSIARIADPKNLDVVEEWRDYLLEHPWAFPGRRDDYLETACETIEQLRGAEYQEIS